MFLPVPQLDVEGERRRRGEGPPELLGQLRVERGGPEREGVGEEVDLVGQEGPTRQVESHVHQCLVEGKGDRSETPDAGLVPQGLGQCLTDGDADVLHGVVGVHLEIPPRLHGEVDPAVTTELAQHVVEEGQAGGHRGDPGPVDVDGHLDGGLLGRSGHRTGPGR